MFYSCKYYEVIYTHFHAGGVTPLHRLLIFVDKENPGGGKKVIDSLDNPKACPTGVKHIPQPSISL